MLFLTGIFSDTQEQSCQRRSLYVNFKFLNYKVGHPILQGCCDL